MYVKRFGDAITPSRHHAITSSHVGNPCEPWSLVFAYSSNLGLGPFYELWVMHLPEANLLCKVAGINARQGLKKLLHDLNR